MQPSPLFVIGLLAATMTFANAQPRQANPAPSQAPSQATDNAPKSIGKFEQWQAATHQEGGQQVCYAFTRATSSLPTLSGRGDVVLTVTHRTAGRDAVAISAGFAYPVNAEVQVTVEPAQFVFYTASRSAFARDGRAAVAAFERGKRAVAKSPGPRNATVTDTFDLRGFSKAHAAINKACPAK